MEAIASVAPGLCLGALSKVPIEIYKFLIEVPVAKVKSPCPFKYEVSGQVEILKQSKKFYFFLKSHFRQLKDLYSFEGPVDDSESALKDFTEKRTMQLKELEIALRLAINGEEKTAEVSDER